MKGISIDLEANNKPVVVDVSEYRGKFYLGARFMYLTQDGELRHSKNGISIQIDGPEGTQAAHAVIEAMQAALAEVEAE